MLIYAAIWLGIVVLMILGAAWAVWREKEKHSLPPANDASPPAPDDIADPLADRAEDVIEDLQTATAALKRWSRYGGDRFGRDSWHFLDRAAEFAESALEHLDEVRSALSAAAAEDNPGDDPVHDSGDDSPAEPPTCSPPISRILDPDALYDIRLWRRDEITGDYQGLGVQFDVKGSTIQDVGALVPYGDGTDRAVRYMLDVQCTGARPGAAWHQFFVSCIGPAAPPGWTFSPKPPEEPKARGRDIRAPAGSAVVAGTAGVVEQIHPKPGEVQGKDRA